ncbi:hypothetical protein ABW19_dt0204580 [Dactylella cylindrospora]|nr:hypothetical protein ABW19_dt0204580 [Dactylella cylindrospora]
MPKSRQPFNYTYKPSYQLTERQNPGIGSSASGPSSINRNGGASSTSSSNVSHSLDRGGATTVKDLLTHLRLTQPATIPDDREGILRNGQTGVTSLATHPTVHPSLQAILGLVDTLPPRPRARGFAGPNSWRARNGVDPYRRLNDGASTTSSASGFGAKGSSTFPSYEVGSAFDLEHMAGFDNEQPSSLVYLCLRSIVRNWDFHVVYDKFFLRELRPSHKSLLLAHLAAYTLSRRQQDTEEEDILSSSVNRTNLEILFRASFPDDFSYDDEAAAEEFDKSLGIGGTENVSHLNFAGSIGYSLSLKDLIKLFTQKITAPPEQPSSSKVAQKKAAVLDSWEDFDEEEDEVTQIADSLSPSIKIRHFANLTHLSLAYPNSNVLFSDLLKLSKDGIPTITHLSLAGWPTPTSGASSFSLQARVGINLKHLSRNLICLRYLDVSDCDSDMYVGLQEVDWAECWKGVDEVIARQGQALSAWGVKFLNQRKLAIVALDTKVREIRRECKAGFCRFVYNIHEPEIEL